jgi:peroxiredoxin
MPKFCSVLFSVVSLLLYGSWPPGAAALLAAETPAAGFQNLLEKQSRATFQAVADYVAQHPEAPDAGQAYAWLFENAVTLQLEVEALPVAERFLKQPSEDPALRTLAQQVQALGFAKSGQLAPALEIFDSLVKATRFRSANSTFEFGLRLANQVQVTGEAGAVREVYERLASAFPLNPQLRERAETRLAQLALVGRPAPPLKAQDLQGKAVDLSEFAGKVVILDFWATNCGPCLEEMPNLKRLYQEFQPRGLEIVGVSLDDDQVLVEAFQKQAGLPWRLVMDDAPEGAVSKRFQVVTIPAVFVVDQKGDIVNFDLRGRDLRTVVTRLLAGPAAAKSEGQ